jgi:hypothetical protein
VPGTPDEVKEKFGTPCKINFKNTQPVSVLQIEKKVKHGYINFTAYILKSF